MNRLHHRGLYLAKLLPGGVGFLVKASSGVAGPVAGNRSHSFDGGGVVFSRRAVAGAWYRSRN